MNLNFYTILNCFLVIHSEVKFAAYMLVGTHLTACVWFLLACSSLSNDFSDPHTCNVNSWALKEPFSATPLGKYIAL